MSGPLPESEEPAAAGAGAGDVAQARSLHIKALRLSGGDGERADELEQRVRVRVWQAESTRAAEIRSLGAFRHGVLVNIHREVSREEKRHRHLDVDVIAQAGTPERMRSPALPPPPRAAGTGPLDPAVAAERGELFRLVRRAVRRLTETTRMVVKMRYFDDLQQRQIARAMGLGEVKVSRILARARRRLKQLLK